MVPLVELLQRRVEHAVDAVLDEHLAVLGLDVDVGGPAVDRAQDQRVHEAHDRALRGQHPGIGDVGLVVGHELQAQRLARLLEHQLTAPMALERLLDALARRHDRFHRPAEEELDLVHLQRILQPAEGEHQPASLPSDGNAAEAHEQRQRRFRPQLGIVGGGVEGLEWELEGDGVAPSLLGHLLRES